MLAIIVTLQMWKTYVICMLDVGDMSNNGIIFNIFVVGYTCDFSIMKIMFKWHGWGNGYKKNENVFNISVLGYTCDAPIVKGTCHWHARRWGYDKKKGRCILFWYSGCGGNGNNFPNRHGCNKQCKRHHPRKYCSFYIYIRIIYWITPLSRIKCIECTKDTCWK